MRISDWISDVCSSDLMGTLFDRRDGDRHVQRLGEGDAAASRSSAGMHLIRNFWGSYLAITSTEKNTTVLRDPSGGIACYYACKIGRASCRDRVCQYV